MWPKMRLISVERHRLKVKGCKKKYFIKMETNKSWEEIIIRQNRL